MRFIVGVIVGATFYATVAWAFSDGEVAQVRLIVNEAKTEIIRACGGR